MLMRVILGALGLLVLLAETAFARVGDPLPAFAGGPLMQQLQLTPSAQATDAAARQSGRLLPARCHRFGRRSADGYDRVQRCAQQPERNVSTLRRVYDAIHADGRRAAARTR